jgi:putative endopeptidase
MKNRHLLALALVLLIFSVHANQKIATQQIANPKAIDTANMDFSVKPGDDFYLYANGNWLKNNPIPNGYSTWKVLRCCGRRMRKYFAA